MSTMLVHGKYLVVDSETVIENGAVLIRDDLIAETGDYDKLKASHPDAERIGGDRYIVLPGFVNAHSHGKGITDFQRGQVDDSLETWKWRVFPPIDQGLDTLYFTVKCIEAGVTTTMHNHNIQDPSNPEDECSAILQAYHRSALRVCFSPVLSTAHPFVYGDDTAFVESLPSDLKKTCRAILDKGKRFGLSEYMDLHSVLQAYADGDRISLFHGPLAPQWVDDDALVSIAEDARKRSIPLHLHTQQTRLQNLYGYKAYGHSLIRHLAELGILRGGVTCGHCVWVSEEDIDILAATDTSVTHHPACNVRIRNGIAPVDYMVTAGVTVALGMDDKDMNDNRDFLEDMRLAYRLHGVNTCLPDAPRLGSRDFFRMATENGARVLGKHDAVGRLLPGMKADVLLADLKSMTEPFTYPDHDIFNILLYRGKGTHIDTVLIDGRVVMKNHRITFLDRDALVSEVAAAVPSTYADMFKEYNRHVPALREHIAAYYRPWCLAMEDTSVQPFYAMNSRQLPIHTESRPRSTP